MMEEHQPPAAAPGAGGEPRPAGEDPLQDPRVLQILSAEHWGLLSARSLVYNEAFARAGMFLTFVSASLVALALASQAMAFDRTFLILAAILMAFDIVVGVATYGRMMDATLDDLRSIQGMNRIRNGYAQIAPAVLPFLAGSIHDDAFGVMATYGGSRTDSRLAGILHGLTTSSGMVGTIIALIAGALAADVVLIAIGSSILIAPVGLVAFLVAELLMSGHSIRTIRGFELQAVSQYPTPPED
jgi:hypothetical protein